MKSGIEALNAAWQAASQEMYQDGNNPTANEQASNTNSEPNQDSEDDVTDVEFEEVDDK